jgi:LysM repeat protein
MKQRGLTSTNILVVIVIAVLAATLVFLTVAFTSARFSPFSVASLPTRAATAQFANSGGAAVNAVETPLVVSAETESVPTTEVDETINEDPPLVTPIRPLTTTHIVGTGENVFHISQMYGVSMETVLHANGIQDLRSLHVGQELIIPLDVQFIQPTSSPTTLPLTPTLGIPYYPPPPATLNGIPLEFVAMMSPSVKQNIREIYVLGQMLGNDPRAFSKVGDSTSASPFYLTRFDSGPYNLGPYLYLQETIDHYSGSFSRQSVANRVGMHAWTVTDPSWANKRICLANESPIACEIRLHRPMVILIRLGSNDTGVPSLFDTSMRQAVQIAIQNGVIPVIGTKPDRFEGQNNANNAILRQIAADFEIPLWELDVVAGTIPDRGLRDDNVHLTFYDSHDYTSAVAFQRGHAMQNLTALIALDAVRREVETLP